MWRIQQLAGETDKFKRQVQYSVVKTGSRVFVSIWKDIVLKRDFHGEGRAGTKS